MEARRVEVTWARPPSESAGTRNLELIKPEVIFRSWLPPRSPRATLRAAFIFCQFFESNSRSKTKLPNDKVEKWQNETLSST